MNTRPEQNTDINAGLAAAILKSLRKDTPAEVRRAVAALASHPTKAPSQAAIPCEGSVMHSDQATFDQRWCLAAGRYCRSAGTEACRAKAPSPVAGDVVERLRSRADDLNRGVIELYPDEVERDYRAAIAALEANKGASHDEV
jgi:hypothetical protein